MFLPGRLPLFVFSCLNYNCFGGGGTYKGAGGANVAGCTCKSNFNSAAPRGVDGVWGHMRGEKEQGPLQNLSLKPKQTVKRGGIQVFYPKRGTFMRAQEKVPNGVNGQKKQCFERLGRGGRFFFIWKNYQKQQLTLLVKGGRTRK